MWLFSCPLLACTTKTTSITGDTIPYQLLSDGWEEQQSYFALLADLMAETSSSSNSSSSSSSG
jgi:hypothetical protein